MCFGGGGSSQIANQQRSDEVARQDRIRSGMGSIANAFSGFDQKFYDKRAADYSAYAMPEVNRQAGLEHKDLIYALSRTGNLDSSAAIDKNADLNAEENKQRIGVANAGLDSANQLRSQVENTRGNVVSELNATGDNSASAASALRQVQGLNQPAGFSPIGNLFASFANSVANIGSRAGNGYSGFTGAGAMSPALFGGGSGSQQVVR